MDSARDATAGSLDRDTSTGHMMSRVRVRDQIVKYDFPSCGKMKTCGSQTGTSSPLALKFQHFHVRDEWVVFLVILVTLTLNIFVVLEAVPPSLLSTKRSCTPLSGGQAARP